VIEHFNYYLQDNYNTFPAFSGGTFEEVLNKAFYPDALEDVRLSL
jgi:hypothetical protein